MGSTDVLNVIREFFENNENAEKNEYSRIATEIDGIVLAIMNNGIPMEQNTHDLSSKSSFELLERQTNDESFHLNLSQDQAHSNDYLSFKNPLVENIYVVSSFSWHHEDNDIFAVGYSLNQDKVLQEKGRILIWDVKSPNDPKHWISTDCEVSAISFSKEEPSVLAVGLSNGCIVLYDTDLRDPFMVDSFATHGRHMSSVSQLRWISDKENGLKEKLISIGADGKVLKWSVQKTIIPQSMITLKRHRFHSKERGYLQNAMGLCIDFPAIGDSPTYICGAEEGSIFRCSWSSNEQYINHICAHNGPVTQVAVSPFDENVIISSGADSTVKMWLVSTKQNAMREIFTISPLKLLAPVNNIAWSPVVPTIFCLVTADSRLEVWDLSHSISEPIYFISSESQIMMRNEMTVLSFSKTGRKVFIGNDLGVVRAFVLPPSCYELHEDVNLMNIISSWK